MRLRLAVSLVGIYLLVGAPIARSQPVIAPADALPAWSTVEIAYVDEKCRAEAINQCIGMTSRGKEHAITNNKSGQTCESLGGSWTKVGTNFHCKSGNMAELAVTMNTYCAVTAPTHCQRAIKVVTPEAFQNGLEQMLKRQAAHEEHILKLFRESGAALGLPSAPTP